MAEQKERRILRFDIQLHIYFDGCMSIAQICRALENLKHNEKVMDVWITKVEKNATTYSDEFYGGKPKCNNYIEEG